MDDILVFGTGSVSEELFFMLDFNKVRIKAFINTKVSVGKFHGIDIIGVSDIKAYSYDFILIASGYVKAITDILKEAGVSDNKIVSFIYDDASTYSDIKMQLNKYLDDRFNRNNIVQWLLPEKKIPELYPSVVWDADVKIPFYYKDYVREQTTYMLSRILDQNHVSGCIAELGVYKGDFTVILDKIFSKDILYLFDTFDGFSETDINNDNTINNVFGEGQKFKDTSEQNVLNRLTNRDRVKVKKGVFPQTFDEEVNEKTFKFISLDFNLESPTYQAISLFYPRMEMGGYMLISDYYAPFYAGTRKAVDKWCLENFKHIVPIADFYGSAVIVKE